MAKTKAKKETTGPALLDLGDKITERTYLSVDGGKTWFIPAKGKHFVGQKIDENKLLLGMWTNDPQPKVSK